MVKVSIESRAEPVSFSCQGHENILYAGLSAGLSLPYDCATGTCGMCKARVKSGEVEVVWPDAPALAKLQTAKGDILMCQTRALTDCTLRVPATVVSGLVAVPRHVGAKLLATRHLTHDVMHLDVALPAPMRFEAGQFVVISVPGLTGGRAYSMVNHSKATDQLELVIKKKPGGTLSDWLFASHRADADIGIYGPLGRAIFKPGLDRDLVCIAGGSGIAGMLSIIEHASASGHFKRHTGAVFFGVRTLADGFYLERFARLVTTSGGALSVVLALSHEVPGAPAHPAYPGIKLAHGFVHDVADAALPPTCTDMSSFVAGPPPMVDGAIRILIGHGVPAAQIRYDKFG